MEWKNGAYYKNKYKVKDIYAPNGLKIVKLTTYDTKLDSVETIYNKIKKENPFTVKGYKITINKETEDENKNKKINKTNIYVLKEKTYSDYAAVLLLGKFIKRKGYW